jgi:hypothetical protein
MVILDGRPVGDYHAALQENLRVHGKNAEVVLIIERPAVLNSDDDGRRWTGGGGLPVGGGWRDRLGELAPGLIPIPVPVEDQKKPGYPPQTGYPPRYPGGPGGPYRSENVDLAAAD